MRLLEELHDTQKVMQEEYDMLIKGGKYSAQATGYEMCMNQFNALVEKVDEWAKLPQPDEMPLATALEFLQHHEYWADISPIDSMCEAVIPVVQRAISTEPAYEGDGYDDNGQLLYDTLICPNCEEHYEADYVDYQFCPKCGQHLDRSNEEGE